MARLSAAAIIAGARIRLNVNIRQPEADSMARDYLPKDAVEQIRRTVNVTPCAHCPIRIATWAASARQSWMALPARRTARSANERAGIGGWINRWQVKARTWTATREINSELYDRVADHERAQTDRVRQSSEILELVERLARLNEDGIECLRLRETYGAELEGLGLTDGRREEALAALDAVVNFHLTLLVGGGVSAVGSEAGEFFVTPEEAPFATQRKRYEGFGRLTAAVLSGAVAGVLLVNSMQVGVAFGLSEDQREWDILKWGDHWMWRGAATMAATTAAAFIAGMIARRRGRLIGALSAVPVRWYWALVAYAGWIGHIPARLRRQMCHWAIELSLFYLLWVLCHAGRHPDERAPRTAVPMRDTSMLGEGRCSGSRRYHFLWLPLLIHMMVMTAAFGGVYGFQRLAELSSGTSMFAIFRWCSSWPCWPLFNCWGMAHSALTKLSRGSMTVQSRLLSDE